MTLNEFLFQNGILSKRGVAVIVPLTVVIGICFFYFPVITGIALIAMGLIISYKELGEETTKKIAGIIFLLAISWSLYWVGVQIPWLGIILGVVITLGLIWQYAGSGWVFGIIIAAFITALVWAVETVLTTDFSQVSVTTSIETLPLAILGVAGFLGIVVWWWQKSFQRGLLAFTVVIIAGTVLVAQTTELSWAKTLQSLELLLGGGAGVLWAKKTLGKGTAALGSGGSGIILILLEVFREDVSGGLFIGLPLIVWGIILAFRK